MWIYGSVVYCESRKQSRKQQITGDNVVNRKKHPRETQMSTLILNIIWNNILKTQMKPSRCLMFDAIKCKVHSIHDKKQPLRTRSDAMAFMQETRKSARIKQSTTWVDLRYDTITMGGADVQKPIGCPCYDKRYQSTKGIKSHATKCTPVERNTMQHGYKKHRRKRNTK